MSRGARPKDGGLETLQKHWRTIPKSALYNVFGNTIEGVQAAEAFIHADLGVGKRREKQRNGQDALAGAGMVPPGEMTPSQIDRIGRGGWRNFTQAQNDCCGSSSDTSRKNGCGARAMSKSKWASSSRDSATSAMRSTRATAKHRRCGHHQRLHARPSLSVPQTLQGRLASEAMTESKAQGGGRARPH